MSTDADIVRAWVEMFCSPDNPDWQPQFAALARLEAAEDECIKDAEEWASKFWQVERQRDALAEALRDLVAWFDEQQAATGTEAITSLLLRFDRARAALAEAGLE